MKMRHEFVEYIPRELIERVLYISIPFATATHLCACGCGHEVVTPLTPADWRLTFDGESVSLAPSIGNWSLACRSHYWIDRGSVRWAEQWSDERIHFSRSMRNRPKATNAADDDVKPDEAKRNQPFWKHLMGLLLRRQ